MRVYQVNVVCGNGSTGKIAVDISREIVANNGECRIAYGRGEAPENVDALRISTKKEVYWHVLMTRLTGRHGLYSKRATKRLIDDIKSYNPDIIHLHNIHGYYLNYEMLFVFLKEYNRPVLWTLHDCWAFTGHCAHFDYVGCEKWKTGCGNCKQLKEYPSVWGVDSSSKNYAKKKALFSELPGLTFVTVSDWLKGVVSRSMLGKYPIHTIYNGIDLEKFCPTESNLRQKYHLEDKKVILGVASVWSEKKGINTFKKLAEKIPEDMQIVLMRVPEKIKKVLPANILCIDNVYNVNELVKWYTMADVYVNASVEETMGLTTIEALACGTPVVVMNATASPELVTEKCGMVVDKDSIDELFEAIKGMKKTDEVSNSCLNRAKEFDRNQKYGEYITLYRSLVES